MDFLLLTSELVVLSVLVAAGWFTFQLSHQNGRLLLRLESLEQRSVQEQARSGARAAPAARIRKVHGDQISADPDAPRLGFPAPSFELPDLSGTPVKLSDFTGQKTFLLFWSPGCSFCKQMLDDLRVWEAMQEVDAPQLLIVSTGTANELRELELRSPVMLDDGAAVRQAFGSTGSPSAVLIDEEGNIASTLARGAPSVLALLKRAPHVEPKTAIA